MRPERHAHLQPPLRADSAAFAVDPADPRIIPLWVEVAGRLRPVCEAIRMPRHQFAALVWRIVVFHLRWRPPAPGTPERERSPRARSGT